MKRNFKLKTLVLLMLVMLGITMVPSLSAATVADMKFTNTVTEDEAETVVSYTVDKTTLAPGDEITLTISLDKLPSNGNGICALSNRIAYDSTKLDVVMCGDELAEGDEYIYLNVGEIGSKLKLALGDANILNVPGSNVYKSVCFNCTGSASTPAKKEGIIAEVKFKVKDTASGNLDMFVLKNDTEYNGFDIAGVVVNSEGQKESERPSSFYVKTNMDEMVIPVPSTDVAFEGITSVELDKTNKKSMDIYQYVKKTPTNTTDVPTFESSNTTVATVDNNGIVTAVGNGSANITVSLGGHTATIPVTVKTSPSSITVTQDKFTVNFGETKNLKAEVTVGPEDVTDGYSMTWTSSNPEFATVDANGIVTAIAKGKTNVTVTAGSVSKTIVVSVNVPLQSITLSNSEVTVWKGETENITVTANPTGAEWDTLETEFVSGAEYAEAKPTTTGIAVTGKLRGSAVVAVSANKNTSGDDLYKLVNVTVKENRVTGASITNETGVELLRGETLTLEGTYTTEVDEEKVHKSTDDTTKVWESLNPEVATVDDNGVITAVREGEATIKLTVAGHEATYVVSVKEIHVDGIVFDEEDQKALEELETLTVGDELKIPFTVTPEGTITDTVEEILDFINLDYDEDLVDVKVEYNKETGEGMITLVVKAAGDVEVAITAGDPEDEEAETYVLTFTAVEPVVEEAPETGDMPVAMLVVLMAVSVMGIVASKKVFVK